MKRPLLLILCVATSIGPALGGELYRWVDERGKVHYGDQPPVQKNMKSQQISGKGNVVEVAKETYATTVAREKSPVTLYSNECGPVCDQAKDFLKQRGVPYTLKDPAKTPETALELKKLIGALEVPVLVIGGKPEKGFLASTWAALLDEAGYPKAPLIPPKP
ncbi:MAG: glutaredoxin family protein [Betaproteobacteria bacterium]|nr:glutaredoxin family protein [Betaproteobacteria bacterium]